MRALADWGAWLGSRRVEFESKRDRGEALVCPTIAIINLVLVF